MNVKNELKNALELIPSDYIAHYAQCDYDDYASAIFVTHKMGYSYCAIILYEDQQDKLYLHLLSVDENFRKKGEATRLLQLHEKICEKIGVKQSILKVLENTWMYDWIKRCGYNPIENEEIQDGYVFMFKNIN